MDWLRNVADDRDSALFVDAEKIVESRDYTIPLPLFLENRLRVLDVLRESKTNSVVLLVGSRLNNQKDEKPFKQDPYFLWMFGVNEPGFWGVLDIKSGKSSLFCPKPKSSSQCKVCYSKGDKEYLKKRYGVDNIRLLTDMEPDLAAIRPQDIMVLKRRGSEKADFPAIRCFKIDEQNLLPNLMALRLKKTKEEVELLRFLASLTSEAMRFIIKFMKPGTEGYAAESMFRYYIQYIGNCREVARLPFCTTVENVIQNKNCPLAMPNSYKISDGDMCYCDMGPSYNGFSTHLITTFPINGKFDERQRLVHDIVVGVREKTLDRLRPPIPVRDFVKAAQKALAESLVGAGILRGPVGKLYDEGVVKVLFMLPLFEMADTEIEKDYENIRHQTTDLLMPSYNFLSGVLEPEMVIRLTSQCFFSQEKFTRMKRLLKDRVMDFVNHGSVVQDVILLKQDSYEILSTNPITADEIEELQNKIDFQDRKGKGIDISNGRYLFPDPDKLIESNLWEIKKRLMKDVNK